MKTLADNHKGNRRCVVPDRILLATDLDDADYLLPHAIAQARASGAALTIVHVTPPAESIPLDASAIYPADAAAITQEATWALEGMAARAYSSSVTCDIMVCKGSPQHIVPELVKTRGADRLILGTHGRQHLERLLLGSVAQEILRKVDVPVCTIGPHAHIAPSHETPQKILHPVSLRSGYEQSVSLAMEMAQFYQAEITLLHVLDHDLQDEYRSPRAAEWTRTELQRLIPDEAPLWTYVTAQVETGGVVDHVLNVATEMQADLIVLGLDAEGSFWPVQGDGTACAIIARAGCPVFTVRHLSPANMAKGESRSEFRHTEGMFAAMF